MAALTLSSVIVWGNPASFLSPFKFEISYECVSPLADDLQWKLIYVGFADDETHEQLLESVFVGPVNIGQFRFVLQADASNPSKIPEAELIGVTVILLTCSYQGQEFIRVGYYGNTSNSYSQLRSTFLPAASQPPPSTSIPNSPSLLAVSNNSSTISAYQTETFSALAILAIAFFVHPVHTAHDLLDVLLRLDLLLANSGTQHPIKMIVIDSIAALFRSKFDNNP